MSILSQQCEKYAPWYRREATSFVIESERPITHVAQEIGVSAGLWIGGANSSMNAEEYRMGWARWSASITITMAS